MEEGYNNMKTDMAPAPVRRSTAFMVPMAIAVIFGGLGFFGGAAYQKSNSSSTVSATGSMNGGAMGGGQMQNGGFGTVSAVSDGSITITEQRQGTTTKTYTITTDTKIIDGTATATVGAIATGDRVMIQTDGSTSTTATQITINPEMPSGGPGITTN